MNSVRRIAAVHIAALVVLAALLLTACGTDTAPGCYEIDIDHPKTMKTVKPAAPKPAAKTSTSKR